MSENPSPPSSLPETPLRTPRSPTELFLVFNRLALQGFGGVLAVAQRELVERERWITREQFVELFSVSQMLPGPNIMNLSLMFGDRHFGLRGALAALAGMLLMPLVIVMLLSALYGHFATLPPLAGALRGMGAVAAGLVIGTGIKLLTSLKSNPMGPWVCLSLVALTVFALGAMRWPLVWVVPGIGIAAMAWAWSKLRGGRP